jgi:RNA polymerase sigma factor (TIGR02999 family)
VQQLWRSADAFLLQARIPVTQPDQDTVTRLLNELSGEASPPALADKLFPLVYNELRALADRYLHKERAGHTLQPTALVHEAYLRLVDQTRIHWQGKAHFYAVCARAMHRILIDHARTQKRAKRGGGWQRVTLDPGVAPLDAPDVDLMALHDALEKLAALDERQVRVVELRFFAGLTTEEAAQVLGVSKRTVESDWTHAKAWLRARMGESRP